MKIHPLFLSSALLWEFRRNHPLCFLPPFHPPDFHVFLGLWGDQYKRLPVPLPFVGLSVSSGRPTYYLPATTSECCSLPCDHMLLTKGSESCVIPPFLFPSRVTCYSEVKTSSERQTSKFANFTLPIAEYGQEAQINPYII